MSVRKGVALIGTGRWAHQLAHAVRRTANLQLVAAYSRDERKRTAFAEAAGCSAAPSFRAVLEHPDVQGVLLATPNHVHAVQAEEAAAAGKHLFIEKPIADTLADALRIRTAAGRAGVCLLVGHAFRRLGAARTVKALLESGRLGQVVLAEANFSLPGTFTADQWRSYRETCPGGPLMQLGIHHIDTLHYWLGPVAEVRGAFAHLATQADIDDVASVQLRFATGVLGTLNGSYVSPKTFDLRLYGTEGVLDYHTDMSIWPAAERMDAATRLTLWTKSGLEAIECTPRDMLAEELEEFGRCMDGAASPETGAVEAIHALQVVLGALASAESRQPVPLHPDLRLPEVG